VRQDNSIKARNPAATPSIAARISLPPVFSVALRVSVASLETSCLLCETSAYLCVSAVKGFRNRFHPDISSPIEHGYSVLRSHPAIYQPPQRPGFYFHTGLRWSRTLSQPFPGFYSRGRVHDPPTLPARIHICKPHCSPNQGQLHLTGSQCAAGLQHLRYNR
jgi:hypothetical protein